MSSSTNRPSAPRRRPIPALTPPSTTAPPAAPPAAPPPHAAPTPPATPAPPTTTTGSATHNAHDAGAMATSLDIMFVYVTVPTTNEEEPDQPTNKASGDEEAEYQGGDDDYDFDFYDDDDEEDDDWQEVSGVTNNLESEAVRIPVTEEGRLRHADGAPPSTTPELVWSWYTRAPTPDARPAPPALAPAPTPGRGTARSPGTETTPARLKRTPARRDTPKHGSGD